MDDTQVQPRLTPAERRGALLGVLLALFMAALDQTVVSTATPMIVKDLAFPTHWITWLTTSYLVTSTALLPIWGKLSDLYGRRPILLYGLGLFVLASVLCAVAQSPIQLVLFRAMQGAGAAAIFANAFAVVGDLFEPRERPKYQGLFGAMFGLSSIFGPWIGGLLTDYISWHWVFLVNVPVGAVAMAFIYRRMPLLRHTHGQHIDFLGAALLLLFVVPLLLSLSLAPVSYAWGSVEVLSLFVLASLSFVFFIRHEYRQSGAIMDLSLFQDKTFRMTALASFTLGAVFLGSVVFVPLYMVNVLGVSATRSGATLTPLTLGLVFGNVVSGQLVSRSGAYKPILLPSLIVLMLAFLWIALSLSIAETQTMMVLKLVLLGVALGPTIPLYTQMMINAAPRTKMGVASASATFVRQMGSSMGLAVLGTLFSAHLALGFAQEIKPELPMAAEVMVAVSTEGAQGAGAAAFDMEAYRAAVMAQPLSPAARAEMLDTLNRVHERFKILWTESTTRVFWWGFWVTLLGFFITLLIPEVPMGPKQTATAAATRSEP